MQTVTWQSSKVIFDLKSSERVNDPHNITPVMCAGGDPVARGHRVMTRCCSKRRDVGARRSVVIQSKKSDGILCYIKRPSLPSYLNPPTCISLRIINGFCEVKCNRELVYVLWKHEAGNLFWVFIFVFYFHTRTLI
jgi:hypothetical protein